MRKYILPSLLAGVFLCGMGVSLVSAAGYDWHWSLRNAGDSSDYAFDLTPPNDGQTHVLAVDGSTRQPKFLTTFASSTSRSITSSTGASGFQPFFGYATNVHYSATITTTATIAGSSSGTLVLEIASTNSAIPGDWREVGRCTNGQALSLAVILQSVQTIGCELSGYVPQDYYVKIRSINNAGTPTFVYNSGQELTDL